MKFEMNGNEWTITELPPENMKKIWEAEMQQQSLCVYGLTKFDAQEIYLNEGMCEEFKRRTLMHELMHCYLAEYVSLEMNQFDDETLCNISANSHDIIHKIVEDYFRIGRKDVG